jgi:hypothetical protein
MAVLRGLDSWCGGIARRMEERRRVTFRFGGDTEVQYVGDVPRVGDFVTHRSEIWVVSRIEIDGLGALVICERDKTSSPRPDGSPTISTHG